MSNATHEDAQLILRLFELRREEKMRTARDWFTMKFFPQSLEDFTSIQNPALPENSYFRMVTSYWDMVASFINHGVLNKDLFFESGGEMIIVWAKLQPFIGQIRENLNSPMFLGNVEKAIQASPEVAERIGWFQERLKAMAEKFKAHA